MKFHYIVKNQHGIAIETEITATSREKADLKFSEMFPDVTPEVRIVGETKKKKKKGKK